MPKTKIEAALAHAGPTASEILAAIQDREFQIKRGKIWQVYPDSDGDNILFEGSRTACNKFLRQDIQRLRDFHIGRIRLGKLIWEDAKVGKLRAVIVP